MFNIPITSDCVIQIEVKTGGYGSQYVNDATVDGALLDGDSTLDILQFQYQEGSNGIYQGIISAETTNTLTHGKEYVICVDAATPSALKRKWIYAIARRAEAH